MSFDIRYSATFKRSAKLLAKKYPSFKQDLSNFIEALMKSPDMGTSLGNNLYKVRLNISSKGKGKSGGARIITCVVYKSEQVLLADIYDKSDYATVDERQILKNLKADGFEV
jgi:hypothetical protein